MRQGSGKNKTENSSLVPHLSDGEQGSTSSIDEITYAAKEEDPLETMARKWKEAALRIFVLVSFFALAATMYLLALSMDRKKSPVEDDALLQQANFHHYVDHRAEGGTRGQETLCICGITRKLAGMSQHASMRFPLSASDLAGRADAAMACERKCAAHRAQMIEQLKAQMKHAQSGFTPKQGELSVEGPTRTSCYKDGKAIARPLPEPSELDARQTMKEAQPTPSSGPETGHAASCLVPKRKSLLGSKKAADRDLHAREHELFTTAPPLAAPPLLLLLQDPLEEKMSQLEKALVQAAEESFREHPATPSVHNPHHVLY